MIVDAVSMISCVGPGCVCEGGDEVSRLGAFPEKVAVRAVGEAGSEGSAEIG